MNKHLCLLAFLSICCRSAETRPAAQDQPIAEARPILVVMEQDPWEMVGIPGSPTFALYDDGTIIYHRQIPTWDTLFLSRMVPDATASSKALLAFNPDDMKSRYEISTWDDDLTTVIWTPTKRIVIYGTWRDKPESERMLSESLPKEIRAALLRIDHERSIEGTAWLPPAIEVMFSPYDNAPGESVTWPKDWPGLHAKETRSHGDDEYSVVLPSGKLAELRGFLDSRKERGAFLIDGQKMSANIRFPFPGEDAWRR